MQDVLYRKIEKGKTIRYVPVEPEPIQPESEPELTTLYNMDDEEALTAAGALGITLLMIFQKHIPPKKLVARKIQAVEDAITDLYRSTGKPIHPDIADAMFRAWNKAMALISEGDGI